MALRAEPSIATLNDTLIGLSERQWVRVLRRLRTAGLLARPDPKVPSALDAHPLVREYYRHKVRQYYPDVWQAGHERLYAHLQEIVLEEYPTTMDTLLPLYEAVSHACMAGRVKEALCLFRHRIRRNDQHFSVEQLGAFDTDLSALSHFFAVLWCEVVPGLHADDQLFLFHAVGECLSALGRVFEAEEPLQKALRLAHRQENWTTAALTATRLSEVYRAKGNLATAVRLAKTSVAYARRSGVPTKVALLSSTFLGFALYWVGQSAAAKVAFQEAEQMQKLANPARPLLHSVLGYMYSELLLDHLESQIGRLTPEQFEPAWCALRSRIHQTLLFAEQDGLPRDIGLQHVSMGRLCMLASMHHGGALSIPSQDQALTHLMQAVAYLRESNHWNYLPRALLTRATLYRLQGNIDRAHADVDEALDIAQSNAMDFYQAEGYLEKAFLFLASYRVAPHLDHSCKAAEYLAKAKACIHTMGYYRRTRKVLELETMLQQVTAD